MNSCVLRKENLLSCAALVAWGAWMQCVPPVEEEPDSQFELTEWRFVNGIPPPALSHRPSLFSLLIWISYSQLHLQIASPRGIGGSLAQTRWSFNSHHPFNSRIHSYHVLQWYVPTVSASQEALSHRWYEYLASIVITELYPRDVSVKYIRKGFFWDSLPTSAIIQQFHAFSIGVEILGVFLSRGSITKETTDLPYF